jgi:hypothetical protein
LKALVHVPLESSPNDLVELRRRLQTDGAGRWNRHLQNVAERDSVAVGEEQTPRGEGAPEHGARREQVRSPIDLVAVQHLLRRHVGQLALELARSRAHDAGLGACDAEVRQARRPVHADHDVLGRNVAMDKVEKIPVVVPDAMRRLQPRKNVEHDGNDQTRWTIALEFLEQPPQRATLDVLHHDIINAVLGPDVDDGHDVGMVKHRRDARFVQQHADEVLVVG